MARPGALKATLLADWLEKKAPEVWWFLDGERQISTTQHLPALGQDLARAFRDHGGRLVVVQDDNGALSQDEITDLQTLENLFEEDDGRALELAWLEDGNTGTPWLLVESVLNEDAKAIPPGAWKS